MLFYQKAAKIDKFEKGTPYAFLSKISKIDNSLRNIEDTSVSKALLEDKIERKFGQKEAKVEAPQKAPKRKRNTPKRKVKRTKIRDEKPVKESPLLKFGFGYKKKEK